MPIPALQTLSTAALPPMLRENCRRNDPGYSRGVLARLASNDTEGVCVTYRLQSLSLHPAFLAGPKLDRATSRAEFRPRKGCTEIRRLRSASILNDWPA